MYRTESSLKSANSPALMSYSIPLSFNLLLRSLAVALIPGSSLNTQQYLKNAIRSLYIYRLYSTLCNFVCYLSLRNTIMLNQAIFDLRLNTPAYKGYFPYEHFYRCTFVFGIGDLQGNACG